MMKICTRLLQAVTVSLLLFATTLAAQNRAPTPPGNSAPPASGAAAMAPTDTVSMRSPKGDVTINSAPAPAPAIGAAPPFAQLSSGSKAITPAQAEAYPPLANDFAHADRNRDGTVDAAEYAHWVKQL